MSTIAKSDGHYINKLSEAFFNGQIDQLTEGTLFPNKNKPDGRAKAEAKRLMRQQKRLGTYNPSACICFNADGSRINECNECPR